MQCVTLTLSASLLLTAQSFDFALTKPTCRILRAAFQKEKDDGYWHRQMV